MFEAFVRAFYRRFPGWCGHWLDIMIGPKLRARLIAHIKEQRRGDFVVEVLGPDDEPVEEIHGFRNEAEAVREGRSMIERLVKRALASGHGSFRVRVVERDESGKEVREIGDDWEFD